MMKKVSWLPALCAILLSGAGSAFAADVSVEGFYTSSGQTVTAEIYATIDADAPLVSCGITVNYDPGQMTLVSAEKNEGDWYFGNGTPEGNRPYMDPDTSASGKVVIVGGKVDSSSPMSGVSGNRVLLGRATFNRASATYRPVITVGYAKTGYYRNFVTVAGNVLDSTDSIALTQAVYPLGDVNHNGYVDNGDLFALKKLVTTGVYSAVADCDGNGVLDGSDVVCIKSRIGKQ